MVEGLSRLSNDLHEFKGKIVKYSRWPNGDLACPVCGFRYPQSAGGSSQIFLSTGDMCPCCKVNYFSDDLSWIRNGETAADQWARLRLAWLDKHGWAPGQIRQIEGGLRLTLDDLEADAERFG